MGSVTVEGEVNGQKLPDERLISISDDGVANLATLRLTGGASFLSLNVTADFAGLQLKDGRLDTELLLKNRNDTQVTHFAAVYMCWQPYDLLPGFLRSSLAKRFLNKLIRKVMLLAIR